MVPLTNTTLRSIFCSWGTLSMNFCHFFWDFWDCCGWSKVLFLRVGALFGQAGSLHRQDIICLCYGRGFDIRYKVLLITLALGICHTAGPCHLTLRFGQTPFAERPTRLGSRYEFYIALSIENGVLLVCAHTYQIPIVFDLWAWPEVSNYSLRWKHMRIRDWVRWHDRRSRACPNSIEVLGSLDTLLGLWHCPLLLLRQHNCPVFMKMKLNFVVYQRIWSQNLMERIWFTCWLRDISF